MNCYIIKRLLLIIPTIILVTIFVFLSVRFVPGNVIDMMAQDMASSAAKGTDLNVDSLRHAMGLDVPVHIQYMRWLGQIVQGNLGTSLWTQTGITDEILSRLPISAELGGLAIIFALLLSIPIGIMSAIRQDTWMDYVGRTIAILAVSLPGFWVATVVIVYPSIWWNWSPATGHRLQNCRTSGPLEAFLSAAAFPRCRREPASYNPRRFSEREAG